MVTLLFIANVTISFVHHVNVGFTFQEEIPSPSRIITTSRCRFTTPQYRSRTSPAHHTEQFAQCSALPAYAVKHTSSQPRHASHVASVSPLRRTPLSPMSFCSATPTSQGRLLPRYNRIRHCFHINCLLLPFRLFSGAAGLTAKMEPVLKTVYCGAQARTVNPIR